MPGTVLSTVGEYNREGKTLLVFRGLSFNRSNNSNTQQTIVSPGFLRIVFFFFLTKLDFFNRFREEE